ncbi:MAG: CPBP family glutamic-type intramembrane protease [Candidatus Bathyarchaeia archaeon]
MGIGADPERALILALRVLVKVLAAASLALYALSFPMGIAAFFLTEGGRAVGGRVLRSIPIELFGTFDLRVPLGASVWAVFLGLLAIYAICFAVAWLSSDPLGSGLIGIERPRFPLLMPFIAGALFLSAIAIHGLQESHGIPTGSLRVDDEFIELFSLTYAPLMEELSYRISPFGAYFSLCLLLAMRRRGLGPWASYPEVLAQAFLDPPSAKRAMGMSPMISKPEWALLAATSAWFGLGHYLSGSGWGPGKITSAAIVGLGLGLAHLKYGAPAPILIHWFFNYYMKSCEMAAKFWPQLSIVGGLCEFLALSAGLVGLGYTAFRALDRAVARMGFAKSVKRN